MRSLLPVIFLLFTQITSAQLKTKPYWQQKLDYRLTANVLPQQHMVEGTLHLEYTNQSPDTLSFIWFHLWANAQANDSTAMAKQVVQLVLQSSITQKKEGPGYITNLNWKVNGIATNTEKHKEWIDVVKLILPKPLLPGATAIITTPFTTVLPAFAFRSGYTDSALFVAHWYPKPAVYDRKGWHPMPYLEMGEYYSEFGRYMVEVSLPSNYVLAATGNLQTTAELEQYRQIGRLNRRYTDSIWKHRLNIRDTALQQGLVRYQPLNADTAKTLRFYADSVHDFAFFTDPRFIIDYDTVSQLSGRKTDVFSFYQKEDFQRWNAAVEDAESALLFYSGQVGEYPFKTVSIVDGPESTTYGGIEYPTITLILTGTRTSDIATEGVIAHEVGHNWFYGMLASNERNFGWMDEGFNTFFETRYGIRKNHSASLLRYPAPEAALSLPEDSFEEYVYETTDDVPCHSIINQPATAFTEFNEYYTATYMKTASWLYALEKKLGKPIFAKCMKTYFSRWKFKHPYPEDVKKVFEEVSGQDLSVFFKQLSEVKQRFNTNIKE